MAAAIILKLHASPENPCVVQRRRACQCMQKCYKSPGGKEVKARTCYLFQRRMGA